MGKEFNLPKNTPLRNPKPALILSGFGLTAVKSKLYNFGEPEEDKVAPVGTSYLGTPVFSNLDVEPGSYKNLEGEQIDFEGIRVDTVLFDVSQQKNIIKTDIQGRNGSVKEYISDGDFAVTIRGAIVNPEGAVYPEEDVLKLVEICKVQKSIQVNSRFLNDVFDIFDLVIESYSFPQSEGIENVQFFELSCVSDDPIELTIRE